jgi:hypothetical protein
VVELDSDVLKVIDISNPSMPVLAGSLGIGGEPRSVFVSGRYAYVVDAVSNDLKVIDLTGAEFSSAIVHSLEAGSLQVRESLIAQGHLQVTGGATIGAGGLFSDGNVGIDGTLALATDIAPTSSPGNAILLYADGDPAELQVRDEAGNVTVLSPHNFSLAGAPSEPLAWSYYSENEDHGRINVDMLRYVRLVEELSGEQLVHTLAADGSAIPPPAEPEASLRAEVEELRRKSEELRRKSEEQERENRRLALELSRIKEALGGMESASSSKVAP